MPIDNDEMRRILTTDLMNSTAARARFKEYRKARIKEALAWPAGPSVLDRKKHVIDVLPTGIEVFFLKPGKETVRAKPNPHDMAPHVGDVYEGATFQMVWVPMTCLSMRDFERFKMVLVLVYRDMCFTDHQVVDGKVRYMPSSKVRECIDELDKTFSGLLKTGGLLGLLHFLDLLAWNEDVKYHVEDGQVVFDGKFPSDVGRKTFFQTCIRVTHETSRFTRNVLENSNTPSQVNFDIIYSLMQQFARTRGVASATNEQIVLWLGGYIRS